MKINQEPFASRRAHARQFTVSKFRHYDDIDNPLVLLAHALDDIAGHDPDQNALLVAAIERGFELGKIAERSRSR